MDQSYWKESGRDPDFLILSFQNDDIALIDMELDVTLGDYDIDFYDLLFTSLDDLRNTVAILPIKLCDIVPAFGAITSSKELLQHLEAMFLMIKTLLVDNGCYTDNKLTYNYSERVADGILLEKICKATYTPSNNTDNNIQD